MADSDSEHSLKAAGGLEVSQGGLELLQGGRAEIPLNEVKQTPLSTGRQQPGALTTLEQELLTLGPHQAADMVQVTGEGVTGSSAADTAQQSEAPEGKDEAGERPAEQITQRLDAGAQAESSRNITGGPLVHLRPPPPYGPTVHHLQFEGQVKAEQGDHTRELQERSPDSGTLPREAGVSRGELDRQNTDESMGRHLEGGRDSEEGGLDMEEHDGRSQVNKKQRLVWTAELHSRFMNAVNHLGVKNAVPKTILQLMNVEGMTRENVASHLQKYRLYLKRLAGLPPNARLSPELVPGSSHLYPYVHQPHEVPPSMIMPSQTVHQGYPPAAAPFYPPSHQGEPGAVLGSPSRPSTDTSAPKAAEGRGGEAGPPPYPPAGSIPPSPPHFGYTPELYGSYGSVSHAGWHPLPGPGPGQPPPTQYRSTEALPGSPVPQAPPAHYSSSASGPYGASLFGPAAGSPAGVASPAAYGYPGGPGGGHYSTPAAVGSPGTATGSPQGGQRAPVPVLAQYPLQAWQQDPSQGGSFTQQFWMQPGMQDWQKRWPDAGPPQRKW